MNEIVLSQEDINFIYSLLIRIFVLILFYIVVKKALRIVGIEPSFSCNNSYSLFGLFFKAVGKMIQILLKILLFPLRALFYIFGISFSESGFLPFFERVLFLNRFHKGLLLDGRHGRVSERVSYEHLALIARTGGGKTSSYIIPNIFTLDNASIVVTDLSGELFEKTSGFMAKRGFNIEVLNLSDIKNSLRYNPLYYANTSHEIAELSHILIKSANPISTAEGQYWLSGAEQILNILISCLKATKKEEYINLANLRYLLNNFGEDGRNLDDFIVKYADDMIFSEWKGFTGSGNLKVIQTFVSTALNSLKALANHNLALLTARNSIDFKGLRRKKSIFYLIVPQEKMEFYSFLLNIFYTQLFNFLMSSRDRKNLPVYLLLDEFGHLSIPNFSTIITTIRKYKVSISILLQSVTQLERQYGKADATTILSGGIGSKIFYSGADLETTTMLEKILGTVKRRYKSGDHWVYRDEKVMGLDKIRTMRDDRAIYLYSNKKPIILKIRPYYKSFKFNRYSKIAPYKVKNSSSGDYLSFVEL